MFRQSSYVAGEVLAAFSLARLNAPIDRQQMAVYLSRAQEILEAACSMNERFRNQRQRWSARNADLGSIGIGFAIATGVVVADRFGSDELSEYSMIGEAVNLAASLQGWAETDEILVAADAYAALQPTLPSLPGKVRACMLKGHFGVNGYAEVQAHVFHAPTIWPRIQRDKTSRGDTSRGITVR